MPHYRASCPYKIRPLSFMFWDKISADKLWVNAHPTTLQFKKLLHEPMHATTGWDPYMVKGLQLLLRNKHKGRLNFHP